MKLRSAAVVLVVCLAMLGLEASPALGAPVTPLSWTTWMPTTLIAYDGPLDSVPEHWRSACVDGDWVVWQKQVDAVGDSNIYAYNLKTRTTKVVSDAAGRQGRSRVDGNWVVYEDNRWGNQEIYAFNLATNEEVRVTTSLQDEGYPDVSGDKIVYVGALGSTLRLYDLTTRRGSVLVLPAVTKAFPSISGDRIVYRNNADQRIYLHDLRTGGVSPLSSGLGMDTTPDIDGMLVAWVSNTNIWCLDLAGGSAYSAVDDSDSLYEPRVNGAHVVYWESATDMQVGIYDARVDESEWLTTDTGHDIQPAIDGLNVVYTSSANFTDAQFDSWGDISLGRLIAPVLTARAGASTIAYGAKTTILGSLAENGIALGGLTVAIDRSTDGGHTWGQVTTLPANSSGSYTFTTPALYKKTLYRARYNGQGAFPSGINRFSALSEPVAVNVRASVGTPAGYPKTGRKTRTYSLYGSLKPRQTASAADAGVVVIKCYQRKSGKWKYRKTVKARVYDYDTYSRYKGSVKLSYAGRWRMRAYFKGSPTNAAQYSSWKYVRVE